MKSLIIAVAALAIGTTLGVSGLQAVSAQENGGNSIIENLAEKFNTSADEIKSVFEQTKEERGVERKQQVADSLEQAVKDGDITEEQKQTIESKMSGVHKKMEEVKAARKDLKQWADDNNVDLRSFLPGPKGFHGPRGL